MGNRLTAALIALVAIGAVFFSLFAEHEEPTQKAGGERYARPAEVERSAAASVGSATRDVGPATDPPRIQRQPGLAKEPFELMRNHSRRALDGDAEAQYLIGRTLVQCEATLSLVRKEPDPETAIWSVGANWPPGLKAWTVSEFRRCSELLEKDPFADLPPRQGGYPYRYWLNLAVESGHPVAVVNAELNALQKSPEPPPETLEKIVGALLTGDPDAPLALGSGLLASEDELRRIQGGAWMLVGCMAGGDCGANSAIVPLGTCVAGEPGGCPEGIDVRTYISAALGADAYAKAFRLHEELSRALRARDAAALRAHLDP